MTLAGYGASVTECIAAADILAGQGIEATVVNGRFAKPLDAELFTSLAESTGGIVTAEENVRAGGFGDAVLEALADAGLADTFVLALTMPDPHRRPRSAARDARRVRPECRGHSHEDGGRARIETQAPSPVR